MEGWITRPIGEKFDYDCVKPELVEEGEFACEGCYFSDTMLCCTGDVIGMTGNCFSSIRNDNKDVIFKKVE